MLPLQNRYFALSTQFLDAIVILNGSLTDKFCKGWMWWNVLSAVVVHMSTEMILVACIYAVYECNPKILTLMIALCFAEGLSVMIIAGFRLPVGMTLQPQGLSGCWVTGIPAFSFFLWVPSVLLETILFLFMLYKAWRTYKEDWKSPLLNLIIRDSVLYFLTIFVVLLVNCLTWSLAPSLAYFAFGWMVALSCSLGSRLLLSMWERSWREHATFSLRLTSTHTQGL